MRNFREIECAKLKKGLLFRGESLYKLPAKYQKLLIDEYHIKVIVDLRTRQERESEPDYDLPSIKNIHIPLINMEEMGASSTEEGKETAAKNQQLPDMFKYYRLFVKEIRKEAWTKIFNVLLEEDGAIMFHCTQGKDRTGIVSAMILTLLGADKEAIYRDYLLTNSYLHIALKYKVYSLKFKGEVRKKFLALFKAEKELLDTAFMEIDKLYGSIDNFYKEICSLDDIKIAKLKDKYEAQ